MNWEWFDDEKMFKFFISIILLANHDATKWHGIEIQRGQFITTLDKLSAQLHFSKQQVRTMISKLVNTKEITHQSTHHYSIITICEYDKYQSYTIDNQHTEQHTNNTQITHNQHTDNTQITHNNNDNNEKNDNNDKKSSVKKFTPPTLEEVKAYCQERKNSVDAQRFVDFYTTKGWMVGKNKMKDWQAAVRTWEKGQKETPTKYKDDLNVNRFWNIKN